MRELQDLRWRPSWVSHLGCLKGCLDYLGIETTVGWLYGGTGHAFIINIGKDVCPSGPTAWKTEMLGRLGRNLGYETDCVFGTKDEDGLVDIQKEAWEFVKQALDAGFPCYAWELEAPEFYVVFGYDQEGYYYSGARCDQGCGPRPWQELGNTGIGIVETYSVRPGSAADDRTTVREALSFALEHAQSPESWVFPEYKAGLDGYDLWIQAMRDGTATQLGVSYNAAVWESCRRNGVAFLSEAKERMDSAMEPLLDDAASHYRQVAQFLKDLMEQYPFDQNYSEIPIIVDERREASVSLLEQAKDAEARGMEALARIVDHLN